MANRISINQRDKNRVILTDLLPLEVPLRFSLDGCYKILKSSHTSDIVLRIVLNSGIHAKEEAESFLPFHYKVRIGEVRFRELGLFHPHLLCGFAKFYSDYDDVIVSHCSKSNWSVRYPSTVAKTYRPRLVFSGENPNSDETSSNQGIEIRNEVQSNQSTYFSYSSYRFYYEFLQSKEVESMEVRFSKCKRIDVAKCFHNIYTHSISWASKTKELAKLEKRAGATFDAEFDGLMRNANDGETHGILVGPEVSRIFAELILQQVDVEAENECMRLGYDQSQVSIKRYLDDYHIYYNEEIIASKVKAIIAEKLGRYKLYLNEAKEEDSSRPFITNLSLCKDELRDYISSFLDRMKIASSRKLSLSLFSEVRRITRRHNATYSDTSGYVLSSIHFWICHVIQESRSGCVSIDAVEQAMHEAINSSFMIFSLDPKFRNSIWLNRILIKCARSLKVRDDLNFSIGDRVRAEVQHLLRQVWNKESEDQIEIANVLAALREVSDFGRLPEWFLVDICKIARNVNNEPNYFWFISMIDVLSLHVDYQHYRNDIVEVAVDSLLSKLVLRKSSESIMLAIDLISCPYASDAQKTAIATKLVGEFDEFRGIGSAVTDLVSGLTGQTIFFDWENPDIGDLVAKKVLSFTY